MSSILTGRHQIQAELAQTGNEWENWVMVFDVLLNFQVWQFQPLTIVGFRELDRVRSLEIIVETDTPSLLIYHRL